MSEKPMMRHDEESHRDKFRDEDPTTFLGPATIAIRSFKHEKDRIRVIKFLIWAYFRRKLLKETLSLLQIVSPFRLNLERETHLRKSNLKWDLPLSHSSRNNKIEYKPSCKARIKLYTYYICLPNYFKAPGQRMHSIDDSVLTKMR